MNSFSFQNESLFDQQRFDSLIEGDEDFAQELTQAAITSLNKNYLLIDSVRLSTADNYPFDRSRDLFHGIKSSALNIGCNRLGRCAESLELACKAEEFPTISLLIPAFRQEYAQSLKFLEGKL